MSSTIFGGKRKRGKEGDDDNETSDVDDDFVDELEAPDEDNDSDSDVADLEDTAKDGSSKVDSFNGKGFDAASIINLDSGKRTDVLADKDLVSATPRNTVMLPPARCYIIYLYLVLRLDLLGRFCRQWISTLLTGG
ncbi:uncharacterized protein EDB91DRAFT_1259305 [Suillus paluster]|uniref:uncharacterized protein n=1 Tax=Suillus paluster TaxID=48578 RepID=UPI001B8810FE|nr:uncharacterized protein EDB91DRAFT_1259305 [Suillus paluster]KAG1717769.1 hypothetical protein EDB91DRAFT_1259305 [Suillus paluster]